MASTSPSLVLALCVAVSCAGRPASEDHWYLCPTPVTSAAHWSYEGDTGPRHWGDLDPTYSLARTGMEQSPIDIPSSACSDESGSGALQFEYSAEPAVFVNNGHTLQHEDVCENWFVWGRKRYALRQFHFHTPSEHTINGESFDLEIHLVHQSDDGEIAVVAVLARADPGGLPVILTGGGFPGIEETADLGGTVNPRQFLPADHSAYHYRGSFTTPPCTEGVQWFVLQQPLVVSAESVDLIRSVMGCNHRPVQALNRRTVGHIERP